jgi:succinate dehydrogenase hydrophobic anchor subunit
MERAAGALLVILGIMMIGFSRRWAQSQVRFMPQWYKQIIGPVVTLVMMQVMLIAFGLLIAAIGTGLLIGRFAPAGAQMPF